MTEERKRVLVVDTDSSRIDQLRQLLRQTRTLLKVYTAEPSARALDTIYSDPPDLVIIGQSLETNWWQELCFLIRSDMVFGHLPIVLIVKPSESESEIDWANTPVDDYFQEPFNPKEVRSRIPLIFARAARVRDANPLTRLPGNFSIMREMQSRIDSEQPFAVGYVDLNQFKAYNDYYGFDRGDEILKMTARLLTNAIRKLDLPEAFVGHVGGDDFVFVVPPNRVDDVCQDIIRNFDKVVGDFYDEADRMKGYIEVANRRRKKERFLLESVAIAVVTNEYRPIKHRRQISSTAAELKKRVKSMEGSNYLKDLRGSKEG